MANPLAWIRDIVAKELANPGQPGLGGYGEPRNGYPPASPWADGAHLTGLESLYHLADSSEIIISRKTAKSLPVIARTDRLLATNLGRLTLTSKKAGAPAPLQLGYLQQPEKDRPLASTLADLGRALFYDGVSWLIVLQRDAYGWPARGGTRFLHLHDATFDEDGNLTAAWGVPVTERDVIQFDAPDHGLLVDGRKILRRAVILDRAASLAEDNPVPSADLHYVGNAPLEDKQITDLLNSWMAARRKYGAGFSDKTIEVKTLGIQDSQLLIDAQKQMDINLARQAGAPAWAVDVALEGSTLNYSNRQSRAWELIDLFLSGFMTPISSRLSMNDVTPIGWTTEFDVDTLTRPDQKTRFDTYKVGIDGGFVDQAWIDAQEGQPLKESV